MRARTMMVAVLQAGLLTACEQSATTPGPVAKSVAPSSEVIRRDEPGAAPAEDAAGLAASEQEVASSPPVSGGQWSRSAGLDPSDRLVIRSGHASIEVDSLEPAMAELRLVVQRVGGFVADASVQTGRNQVRSATLELKIPAARFEELTDGLGPLGKLEFVNIGAEDVSEEFVDLTARASNARRLEERLLDLLRTHTGKLQHVLSVERELARVREEIERMEGRLRFLKAAARLSTLSVSLHEPPPLVASHPGRSVIVEAFRTAWRNFVGVLAGAIASLGYVVPVVTLAWVAVLGARRYRRRPAEA